MTQADRLFSPEVPKTPKLAVAFPGQGRQDASIGKDVINNSDFPKANSLFERGSTYLNSLLKTNNNAILEKFPNGLDVKDVCINNPDGILNSESDIAQPLLTLVYITRYQAYLESTPNAPEPDIITAHSLGKIAALYAAESITLEQAIFLSYFRGKFTKAAAAELPGTMGYLNDTLDVVEGICQRINEGQDEPVIWVSSENSPRQQVISGKIEAVQKAVQIAKEELKMRNAGVLPIPYASHSPLMKNARESFGPLTQIVNMQVPKKDLVFNGKLIKHNDGQLALTAIRSILTSELSERVSWPDSDQTLRQQGVTKLFEIGATEAGTLTTSTRVINEQHDVPIDVDWFPSKKQST